jgi:hypothetical protein
MQVIRGQRLVVGSVAAFRIQLPDIKNLRGGEGTERCGRRQRIDDAVLASLGVAPGQGIKIPDLDPRTGAQAIDHGEDVRLVATHRQQPALELRDLMPLLEVERLEGSQDLQKDVALGHTLVEQFRRPEAEGHTAG